MDRKKKLLVIHSAIAPYRVDFFNALSRAFDFRMILFAGRNDMRPYDEQSLFSSLEFKPSYMTERYGLFRLKSPKGYMKLMKDFIPDVILTLEFSQYAILPLIYRKLYNHNCKIVSIVDDSFYMLEQSAQQSKLHGIAEKLLLPLMDQVINLEPRVTSFFQKHYNKGICFPIMHHETCFRQKLEKALPLAQEYVEEYGLMKKKVFLYVGQLIPRKNLSIVIKCFKELPQDDAVLVIVGDGTSKKELETMSSELGNVIFTGRLGGERLYAWYNAADIFVLASTQECYGAVTNEALLAGCKVIVSKNAGSQCLVKEGENGYIIEPYSSESIISALEKAMDMIKEPNRPVKLKPNAMPFTFESYIGNIIDEMNK